MSPLSLKTAVDWSTDASYDAVRVTACTVVLVTSTTQVPSTNVPSAQSLASMVSPVPDTWMLGTTSATGVQLPSAVEVSTRTVKRWTLSTRLTAVAGVTVTR